MAPILEPETLHDLAARARAAALSAYAPYSRFRVGAVVLGEKGYYLGANIENATYGATLCAERAALSNFRVSGETTARAIAVACIDASSSTGIEQLMPCGICRQWFVELAPNAVIVACAATAYETFTVEELLPRAFRLTLPAAYRTP